MARVRNLKTTLRLLSLFKKAQLFLDAIKFQESIFALPFAYTGMVLAADGWPGWYDFLWITAAMICARTLGMTANRVIDRQIDSKNPRNAARHLPAGKLSVIDMKTMAVVSLGIFLFAAYKLNLLSLVLAPVAAAYLIFYPYTKRFTWTANLLLGVALAMAPIAAWIGVTGSLVWQPLLLSLAVALWAGSFDILYHTQDYEFHTKEGLHSVAKRFGIVAAFRWAKVMDILAMASLISLGIVLELTWPFYLGLAVAAVLLWRKYLMVSPQDLSRLGMAFFRINAYVSTTILAMTLIALLVKT